MGSGATFYYLTDGLGSTMALTDAAGDVGTAWDYDVFGAVRNLTGSQPNDFTFAGEQSDPNGLDFLRARYYDPEVGRCVPKPRRSPVAAQRLLSALATAGDGSRR